MHFVNALAFLVWRFRLLGPFEHYQKKCVSVGLFGHHRSYGGAAVMFTSATLIYSVLFGQLCIWPGIGMVAGTFLNSFVKRRLSIKPGGSFPVIDQLDFFLGGVAGLAVCGIYLNHFIIMAGFSIALHISAEVFAYLTGMKDTWW